MPIGRSRKRQVAYFECPNCGADVRTDALACPECGSDAETGWSDETIYDGLDLPWDGAEDERPLRPGPSSTTRWVGIAVLIAVLIALIL